MAAIQKGNCVLKERSWEQDRYKRRWNLRINHLKEHKDKNIREVVVQLLSKVNPTLAPKMDEVVDSVHRLGKAKADKTTGRQVILQFVRRVHRDEIWKLSKDCQACKDAGVKFAEDLTPDDRRARNDYWPIIESARKRGKKAYFSGPFAVIDGRRTVIPIPDPPEDEELEG